MSRVDRVYSGVYVCLYVCAFVRLSAFPLSQTARITTHDTGTVHMCPGNPFILGSEGQRSRPQGAENMTDVGDSTLVSAGSGFF